MLRAWGAGSSSGINYLEDHSLWAFSWLSFPSGKQDSNPLVHSCAGSLCKFMLSAMKLCSECFTLTVEKQDEQWAPARAGQLESKHTAIFSNPVGEFIWSPIKGLLLYYKEFSMFSSRNPILFCGGKTMKWFLKNGTRCHEVNYPLKK